MSRSRTERMRRLGGEAMTKKTVLLSLAFAGGSLDVTSYLAFGKIFTANMTGNTVVLAAALADGVSAHALRAAAALGGYCLGTFVGALLIPASGRPWPASARAALHLQLLIVAAVLIVWAACGVRQVRYELIAMGAAAMGLQSATALASGVSGVNTTYMTGTLTQALARLAKRVRPGPDPDQGPALGGSAWITYGAGALAGAFAVGSWHYGVISLPLAIIAAVCVRAWLQPPLLPKSQPGSEVTSTTGAS